MNKKPFLLLLCGVFLLSATLALAAPKTQLLAQATPARKIAFIFYKLADRVPPFANIVKNTSEYRNSSDKGRQQILADEVRKMEIEFAGIDTRKEVIVVRSAVKLKVSIGQKPGFVVSLPQSEGPVYFPYEYAGYNYAVIPGDIEAFMDLQLTQAEASAAGSRLRDGAATMVLELQPTAIDGRKPMRLDGLSQWLLMAKIVGVTYYNQFLQPIWAWKDPAYKRALEASPLEDLKK